MDDGSSSLGAYLMGQAQDCAECAVLLHLAEVKEGQVKEAIQDALKSRGIRAAKARYIKDSDGKQSMKAWVYERWQAWQNNPNAYKGATAFARDMLDKHPNKLTSEVVITRWVRAWARGKL